MRRTAVLAVLLGSCLLGQVPAQAEEPRPNESYDVQDEEPVWQLGAGIGLVNNLDDQDNTNAYFLLNARRRVHRGYNFLSSYMELEAGYWKFDRNRDSLGPEKDLLIGLNGVLVLHTVAVKFFFGAGAGVHFLDTAVLVTQSGGTHTIDSDSLTKLGGNFHLGFEIPMGKSLGMFAQGRLDLVEGNRVEVDTTQMKIVGGLRLNF